MKKTRFPRWPILALAMTLAMALGIGLAATAVEAKPAEPEQIVQLCYTGLGVGRNAVGRLPGDTSDRTHWAGILNVKVNGVAQPSFCTDFLNDIVEGACYNNSTVGVTDPSVACTLQYYPPVSGLTVTEAVARQSVVWYYSDGWTLASSDAAHTRYAQILADVENKIANGQCAAVQTPSLDIDPSDAVNFLAPDGDGGYLASAHVYTVTALAGNQPLAGLSVAVSTNVGTLTWDGQAGQSITAVTGPDGTAQVTISHDAVATATITAQATVVMPVGTRIDPGPRVQKIVLPGNQSFTLEATASKHWVAGTQLVIKKFHDRNRNGVKDGGEEFIDWTVRYRELGAADWITETLGADGALTAPADPGQLYEVCEIADPDWLATTATCYQVQAPATVVFGNVLLPSLLIEKYHDLNGNGQPDAGEPSLDGWGFHVFRWENNQWSQSYSGSTANGGLLGFSGLEYPRLYRVNELVFDDWYASTAATQQVGVVAQQAYTLAFGNLQTGELRVDKVWYIAGIEAPPPTTPAHICVKRSGPGAPAQLVIPTDANDVPLIADGDGAYCQEVTATATWKNLWPGVYQISEAPPAGWAGPASIPDAQVLSGQVASGDAAIVVRNDLISLGDFVWEDIDGDGLQGAGEPGLPGVLVDLYAGACPPNGSPLASQTTDGQGVYQFVGLASGVYCVQVAAGNFGPGAALDGYQATQPNAGDDALDSDGHPLTLDVTVDMSGVASNMTVDFGFYRPACLGDLAWVDSNNNGAYEPADEFVLNNAGLAVINSQGQTVASYITGPASGFAPGMYLALGLAPGTYQVIVADTPPGHRSALPGEPPGLTTTLLSGQCDLEVDFPFVITTGIAVSEFTAQRQGEGVLLRWTTLQEAGNAGFHVWRATSAADQGQRLTAEPVASQAAGSDGASYQWLDSTAQPNSIYWYRLATTPGEQIIGPVRVISSANRLFLPMLLARR